VSGQDISLAATVPLAAYRVRRERRLQEAEAAIAHERLLEVVASLPAMEVQLHGAELRAAAEAGRATGVWDKKVVPVLDQFDRAARRQDANAVAAAAVRLAEALGVSLRFKADEEIIKALGDASMPLSLGRRRVAGSRPSDELVAARLGVPVDPPAGLDVDAVFSRTRERHAFAERDAAGVQLLRPGPRGFVYDHHGLLIGDGSVVHFSGKADRGRKHDALVRRVSLDGFLAYADVRAARAVIPRTVRSRDVVALRPAVASLRALGAIGSGGYRFLRNNCEHLATWSLLGASHSSQTRLAGQLQRWAEHAPELTPFLKTLIAEDVTVKRAPIPSVASSEGEDPIWYDVGRAFWSPEGDDLVAWLPIWRDGPALASADHPWRAMALTGELTPGGWTPIPPVPLFDGGWHAALVTVVSGARDAEPGRQDLYWVLPDRSWRRETTTFAAVVEPRLRHAQMLIEALGKSLLETLSDIHDAARGARSPTTKELGPG
jgi:hypothetical protein